MAVVENFDVLGNLTHGLSSCFIATMMHEFILGCAPETFHPCIVETIPFAAHEALQTELTDYALLVMRTVLAAAIAMER